MGELLSFKPFCEYSPMRVYFNGFFPHWRQDGCTYFVTFRLADSVPHKVLAEWKYDRDKWLEARGCIPTTNQSCSKILEELSSKDRELFVRRFAGRLFRYLDRGYGECYLRDECLRQIIVDSLMFFHGERVTTGDFVIMPNHVHAVMTPLPGYELEDILHSIKSFTANEINKVLGRTGTLWMDESFDRIVRDFEELLRTQRYIERNPAKAGLAPSHYSYRRARYRLPT
ncbi:MAG: transposase [Planctomycetota bacterium]